MTTDKQTNSHDNRQTAMRTDFKSELQAQQLQALRAVASTLQGKVDTEKTERDIWVQQQQDKINDKQSGGNRGTTGQ